VRQFQPRLVIVDPVSNLMDAGTLADASGMLSRLLDFLKAEQITAALTCLTGGAAAKEATDVGISSVIDTWILLRDIELGGERNRGIYVLKSRGMPHSNQIREFLLTSNGIGLAEVYVGPEGVLTGSMRLAQETRERNAQEERQRQVEATLRGFERKRRALEAQMAGLRVELEQEEAAVRHLMSEETERIRRLTEERSRMARSRKDEAESKMSVDDRHDDSTKGSEN
jgi:circadian clock protein KaiC